MRRYKFVKYCPGPRKEKRRNISYSVYASECTPIPGVIEQCITLDLSPHPKTGSKRFWKYPIEFEVKPKYGDRNGKRDQVFGGNSQAHRLGKTRPGKMRRVLETLEAIHSKARNVIKLERGRYGKLDYISEFLMDVLKDGSLLVHRHKLELLEHSRNARQARFLKRGVQNIKRVRTKKEARYERREENDFRFAREPGFHNNEERDERREDIRSTYSDAGSRGSWKTTSSNGNRSPSISHFGRHDDHYRRSQRDDDDYPDDEDTQSRSFYASTVPHHVPPSRDSQSRSSRSSSSGSDDRGGRRARSGYGNY